MPTKTPLISITNRITILLLGFLLLNAYPADSSPQQETLKKSSSYKIIPVNVLKKISLPKGYHEGLSLDGADIWVINGEKGKILVVDTVSGKVTSAIEPIAGFSEAISRRSGNSFFVTDWDEKRIYKARLDNNKLTAESSVSVSPAHPAGALWTGDRLFVIAWTRGMGTKFNLLEMDGEMKLLRKVSIQAIQEPAHLAWDGKYLWITGWYDSLVYKVDMDNLEISGDFLAPIPRATGIVWDGKYFWLTGTYSDLYQVEVTNSEEVPMKIIVTSSAFNEGDMIPSKYTCDGDDMSPPLSWSGIPPEAKSIAMISDDPDAPRGTWVHWVIYNIPPEAKGLPGSVPPKELLENGAIQGINDSHQTGYGGPCPPSGVHRYYFKVYALNTKLSLNPGVTKKSLEDAMKGHVLSEGQLMGKYKR